MKNDFSCGVIPYRVINGKREFLLIQHKAGHWAFPKGHPEKGETEQQTARRELAEETGISDVEIDEEHPFKEHYTFAKRDGKQVSKCVVYFLGQVAADQAVAIQEAEVSDHTWGSASQTLEQMSFDEGRALLDEVLAYLGD